MQINQSTLEFLLREAKRAFPGCSFKFSTEFFEKEKNPSWQIVMHRNQGDMRGVFFFCQGEGSSLTIAETALTHNFLCLVKKTQEDLQNALSKHIQTTQAYLDTLNSVIESCQKGINNGSV